MLESAPPDTYITTVYAVDYDSGKNSLLSYTIPSDQQDFYIHRTKGIPRLIMNSKLGSDLFAFHVIVLYPLNESRIYYSI